MGLLGFDGWEWRWEDEKMFSGHEISTTKQTARKEFQAWKKCLWGWVDVHECCSFLDKKIPLEDLNKGMQLI